MIISKEKWGHLLKNLIEMKRRKFLVHTIVGSAVLGLAPLSAFSKGISTENIVSMPEASSHIRHGLLSPERLSILRIDGDLSVFGKQIFFKNGFEKSEDDLINFSFQLNNETLCLSWVSDNVYLNERKFTIVPGVVQKIYETEKREIFILKSHLNIKEQLEIANGDIIPLQGIFELNRKSIDNDMVISVDGNTELLSKDISKILIFKHK